MKSTVQELKARMSQSEFEQWQVFYAVRPFGDEWEDYRFGVLAANIMSTWASGNEGVNIELCMPYIAGRDNRWRGRQRPEDIAAILASETRAVEAKKCPTNSK